MPLDPSEQSLNAAYPVSPGRVSRLEVGTLKEASVQTLLVFMAALYLYLNLFSLSIVPYFLGGDQTFFWAGALRMLHGQHPYRDFFQFTPPGADLFYLGLFRLLGTDVWVTNAAVLLVGTALSMLCYRVSLSLMDRSWALLASAFYLVCIYARIPDATHHWFSTSAAVCALWVMFRDRSPLKVCIAGTLLGLSSFFTQTTGFFGLLGILAAFQLERQFRSRPPRIVLRLQALLVLSFALTCSLEAIYFIADAGWRRIFQLLVLYPSNSVAGSLLLPALHLSAAGIFGLLIYCVQHYSALVIMACVYPWSLWYALRSKSDTILGRTQAILLSSTGLFLLLEVMIRPNWHRISMASMPAIILGAWLLAAREKIAAPGRAILWIAVACFGLWHTLSVHRQVREFAQLPGAQLILVDRGYGSEFAWLAQHTRPGDTFLDSPWPLLYLPFKLYSPIYADGMWTDQGRPAYYVEQSIQQLERSRTTFVLWSPWLNGTVCAAEQPGDSLKDFRSYLRGHYRRVQTFPSGDEVWQISS